MSKRQTEKPRPPELPNYMLSARRNPDRPFTDARWGDLQQYVAKGRQLIADMYEIYEDTGHPKARAIIEQIEKAIEERYSYEEFSQLQEINEVLTSPHRFPLAVVTWIRDYRDKELQ